MGVRWLCRSEPNESEGQGVPPREIAFDPPIIDEEFLQRLLAEIALRRKANPPKGNHLFSGVVVCLGCNKRMMVLMKGSYQIKKGKVYSYPILKCYNGCGKQIAFARIERALLAWFDNIQ